MGSDDSTFFTRWSRRKVQARVVTPAAEPVDDPMSPPTLAAPAPTQPAGEIAPVPAPPAAPPAPTMDDVAMLTSASDYSRFVKHQVTPEVRNAALKKLFADPQFNVMDGLDIYVGDYSQPDPMPAGMLRQMVQSKLLGLFDDEASATDATAATLPQDPAPAPAAAPKSPECAPHEDTDLQLQPDDDAGCAGADPGPEEDAGRQH